MGERIVTFDGQDSVSIPYGFKLKQPADPIKEEEGVTYTFLGWYVGDKKWNFETDVVTEDMDLQAKWKVSKCVYSVTFEGVSGAKKVEHGDKIPENLIPETPTKDSTREHEYIFDGWYLGDKKWDFETDVVTGDITLKKRFVKTARCYEVTFDGENAISLPYGSKIEKPVDPVKETTDTHRYEFIGWFNGSQEWDFETGVVKYKMNLVSQWRAIKLETDENDGGTDSNISSSDNTQSVPISQRYLILYIMRINTLISKKHSDMISSHFGIISLCLE